MRLNSLALRLFATSAAWTLLALPLAGYIIYSLYREDVQLSFDAQLKKLLTQITVDSMGTGGDVPLIPPNLYEPLFEVTQSGWYWQIRPIDGAPGRTLVSPSLATAVLPSPYDHKMKPDHAHPTFSPDGKRILIESGLLADGKSLDIMTINVPISLQNQR